MKKVSSIILICLSFLAITLAWYGFKTDIEPELAADTGSGIVINEVCHGFSVSENSIGDNYIELYNTTDEEIAMEGYYLLDNQNTTEPLYLNALTLGAGHMACIYIDENWTGMDFTPAQSGNAVEVFTVALCDAKGEVKDSVTVPRIAYDSSWGRSEDGGSSWSAMTVTPGTSNNGAKQLRLETLDAPKYSADSGFYEDEFWLELGTTEKDCTIYYTLDGSVPTENSLRYEEPIRIYDKSQEDNLYASLKTVCSGYIVEDFIFNTTTDEPVQKCMVVRSVVYSNDGTKMSDVVTKSYFIDAEGKYENMPIISLVADPDGLFGYENGIYVTGKTFDDFLASAETMESYMWSEWDSNYWQKGKKWEREAHIDYFDSGKDLVLEQEVGIRIRGGQTRAFPQKSFNVYARSIYDKKEFSVPFFGNSFGKRRVTLASGGNDTDTKIRDTLVYNLCSELEFATMCATPAIVFINGEYWGLYTITEKYDEYFIEEHYGVAPEDVLMVKVKQTEAGENAADEWAIMSVFAYENDFSDDAVYQEFLNYIDLESFLDYYAAQVYIARCGDWPSSNWTMWKSDEVKEGVPYYDGKWRYMIYDLNWQDGDMSEWLVEHDTIAYVMEQDHIFRALMQNGQFRDAFLNRLSEMATTVFENGRVQAEISYLTSIVQEYLIMDYERFFSGAKTPETFDWAVNNIRVFFERRGDYIFRLIEQYRTM